METEVLFEVDFLIKLREFTKQFPILMYHKQNHIVFRNGSLIGNSQAFIELALNEYSIESAEANNTIVHNRLVREMGASMLKKRGRPVVYVEFADAGSRPSDAIRLGVLQIEL